MSQLGVGMGDWRMPTEAYAIFSPEGEFLFFSEYCPSPEFYRGIQVEVSLTDDRDEDTFH